MAIDNQKSSGLKGQIEQEIRQYLTETVNVGSIFDYSQYKLVRRIALFEAKVYPTGKFDSQGNYKYWYDIINPRIEAEIKNIDYDTKDVKISSDRSEDDFAVIIANLKLKEYLRDTDQDEEINTAIEQGSGWGNCVWKKIKGTYERTDLRNFYVINQTAECLDETPAIERHQLSAKDLRDQVKVWDNVSDVLENCKTDTYKAEVSTRARATTVPYYDIYERNGEVCVYDLKEAKGMEVTDEDKDKYVLAKVISAGSKGQSDGVNIEYIMYAEEISEMPYEEYHRGRYKGRWWREGLYEILFDLQVRANQIGNQLAQGLELASKTILFTPDKLIMQNILTDLKNGDIIKTSQLSQVNLRMDAFDQLVTEWNQILSLANDLANSSAIVRGTGIPSGAPYRTVQLLNQNANKLFDFIREKLGIVLGCIFREWLVPDLITTLSTKDVLRLSGDSEMMARLQEAVVENWYVENLIAIGPHGQDVAETLKQQQLDLLQSKPELLMQGTAQLFKNFVPNVDVIISGANSNKDAELQTMESFIGLESDPVRRSALVELAMKRAGIDVGALPQSTPEQLAGGGVPMQSPSQAPSDLRAPMAAVSH